MNRDEHFGGQVGRFAQLAEGDAQDLRHPPR